MIRLETYNPSELASLPVDGKPGERTLRSLVKAEFASGNLSESDLASVGCPRSHFGTWVKSKGNKVNCLALLTGNYSEVRIEAGSAEDTTDYGTPAPQKPATPLETSVSALPPVQSPDALAAAMAALKQAFGGGVDANQVRQEVAAMLAPTMQSLAETLRAIEEEKSKIQGALDRVEQENQRLRAEMLAGKPLKIAIVDREGEQKDIGRQHYLFPLLLAAVQARINCFLTGPAGSFKSTAAHMVAESLELAFEATSVCQQSTKSDLLGFIVPGTGQYHASAFRRCYEQGGVFLLDEIDNGNANILAVLNAALANGSMGFPDGQVKRHKDFVLIAAGNTFGTGADRLYVGRNQLDAATLDRFFFVEWGYDKGLEAEIVGIEGKPSPACNLNEGGSITVDGWENYIRRVQTAIESTKQRAVVSSRALFIGKALAEQGIGRAWLERGLIWKGMDRATMDKVKAAMPA